MKEEIKLFFDNLGYTFDEEGNIDIQEIDSLEFINLVVSIEEKFDIDISDEYLLIEHYQNIDSIENIIEMCKLNGGNT